MRVVKGDVFGSLLVLGRREAIRASGARKLLCVCECECGSIIDVEVGNLNSGNTKQCNDCAIKSRADHRRKHNFSMAKKGTLEHKTYYTWLAMKRRCYNKNENRYDRYGGRGIKICNSWIDNFECFLIDMGLPPSQDHQIDRGNNDGDYSAENCKWSSRVEQANNKSNNKNITAFGKTMTQQQWSKETGLKRETIAMRLRRGWHPEKALTWPLPSK